MLDKILEYIEDNYEYVDEIGLHGARMIYYEELKEFIEKLKKEWNYEIFKN